MSIHTPMYLSIYTAIYPPTCTPYLQFLSTPQLSTISIPIHLSTHLSCLPYPSIYLPTLPSIDYHKLYYNSYYSETFFIFYRVSKIAEIVLKTRLREPSSVHWKRMADDHYK